MFAPVVELSLEHVAAQPLALPVRKIDVLYLQFFEWRYVSSREGFVQRAHFSNQNVHGPAIRNYMMHRQQQRVFLGTQTNKSNAQQPSLAQAERPEPFFHCEPADFFIPLILR